MLGHAAHSSVVAAGGAAGASSASASSAAGGASMQAYAAPASHGMGAAAAAAPHPLSLLSSAGGMDPAAAHSAAMERRKGKVLDLSPAVVASHRAGWTRLVSVRAFAADHAALQSQLRAACQTLDSQAQLPDLNVDDLRIDTPFQAIEKQIEKEVIRATTLQEQAAHDHAAAVVARKAADQERLEQQRAADRERELQMQQQLFTQHQQKVLLMQGLMWMAGQTAAPMQLQGNLHLADHTQQPQQQQQEEQRQQQQQQQDESKQGEAAREATSAQMDAGSASAASTAAASSSSAIVAAAAPPHGVAMSDVQQANMTSMHQYALMQQIFGGQMDASLLSLQPTADAPPAAPSSSAPLSLGAAAQAAPLPPDFGANVPSHQSLMAPLRPLLEQRAVHLGKRGRLETNVMTALTFAHDRTVHTRGHAAEPLPPDEVILRVAVYHPTHFAKMQEFLVCGSQPLTCLRDRIDCLQDGELDGPRTRSACLFIEGTFYNDMRDPSSTNLSDSVVQWSRSEGRFAQPALAPFQQRDMHATTFADLSVRLGAHYFYQHQGDCRHVIVFTAMRMARSDDEQNRRAYPLRVFQGKTKRQICRVCDIYPATCVTYGDALASESPFFFCNQCWAPLHYSTDGSLLYAGFQVYPYKHE